MPITIRGVIFRGRKRPGDFKTDLVRKEHANSLFLISENFLDMLFATENGGGTAAIRDQTWPNTDAPRAVGVPTGWSQDTGGFRALDNTVKQVIDLAMRRVLVHLRDHPHVNTVIYSADAEDPKLIGSGIFKTTLDPAVLRYISDSIWALPAKHAKMKQGSHKPTMLEIRQEEYRYVQLAQALHERDVALRKLRELSSKLAGKKRAEPSTPSKPDTKRLKPDDKGSSSIMSFLRK